MRNNAPKERCAAEFKSRSRGLARDSAKGEKHDFLDRRKHCLDSTVSGRGSDCIFADKKHD